MIICFSGTGNSRFAAEFIAKELRDEVIDAGKLIKAGKKGDFVSDKPYIFVCPIYSWRMPAVFESFLRNVAFSGNRRAYFVLTCGGDIGAAGKYAEILSKEKNLIYAGSLEVVMPDNYILMFHAPEPKEAREIVKKAIPVLQKGVSCIQQEVNFPVKDCNFLDKIKSGLVNQGFNRYFVKAKGFRATDKCIGCGKCVSECMLNNIALTNGKPSWGTKCSQCMACICGCPQGAIEYGKKTVGKVRYQCSEKIED